MMGMYEHSLGGANELIAASPAYSRAAVGTEYLSPYPPNTHGDPHTDENDVENQQHGQAQRCKRDYFCNSETNSVQKRRLTTLDRQR